MSTPIEDIELRDLLRDLIVHGDEKGWVEYTDGGVYITDKGLEVFKRREENTSKVNRLEVIDNTGRAYVKGEIYGTPVKVELSFQDDDRTLKVFVQELQPTTKDERLNT